MTHSHPFAGLLACLLAAATMACSAATPVPAATAAADTPTASSPAARLPAMTVHKHASCGCCNVWIEHMREAGFVVRTRDVPDMSPVKDAAGVPDAMASCHTAQVGGYFIEGHVPAEDVLRLLRERPDARGLAVPGMPVGSPGMEHPDGIVQPYAVHLVLADGSTREFSHHGAR